MGGHLVRGLAILLGVAFVAGMISRCARSDAPSAGSHERTVATTGPTSHEIRQADYAERWPFVRPSATIVCVRASPGDYPAVVLGDRRYAFTGSTEVLLKIPTVPDAEWLDRSEVGYGKIDMDPVRDDAFRFCHSPPPFNPVKP